MNTKQQEFNESKSKTSYNQRQVKADRECCKQLEIQLFQAEHCDMKTVLWTNEME